MIKVGQFVSRNCQGINRGEISQVGGLGVLGFTLAVALRAEQVQRLLQPSRPRSEKSCIFIFLHGGPSPMETFDPKPNAPDSFRGPFGPVATSVPGLQICELLPLTAQRMHRCALIRSMTGFNDRHENPAALTGSSDSGTSYGAVVTKLKGGIGVMPPYVDLWCGSGFGFGRGVGGGVFGPSFDPVVVSDLSTAQVQLPRLTLAADVSPCRFQQRRELLAAIDRVRAQAESIPAFGQRATFYQRAIDVLTSSQVRDAFDLSLEPATDTIGRPKTRFWFSTLVQNCALNVFLLTKGCFFHDFRRGSAFPRRPHLAQTACGKAVRPTGGGLRPSPRPVGGGIDFAAWSDGFESVPAYSA